MAWLCDSCEETIYGRRYARPGVGEDYCEKCEPDVENRATLVCCDEPDAFIGLNTEEMAIANEIFDNPDELEQKRLSAMLIKYNATHISMWQRNMYELKDDQIHPTFDVIRALATGNNISHEDNISIISFIASQTTTFSKPCINLYLQATTNKTVNVKLSITMSPRTIRVEPLTMIERNFTNPIMTLMREYDDFPLNGAGTAIKVYFDEDITAIANIRNDGKVVFDWLWM